MEKIVDNTANPSVATVTAIIIGNGFDIANNLPTRYSDFLKSENFNALIDRNNEMAKHISRVYNLYNWVDVEIEIGNYSYGLEQDVKPENLQKANAIFYDEYKALTHALYQYINSIRSGISNPKIEELVNEWKNSALPNYNNKLFIVNFNYLRWDMTEFMSTMDKNWFVNNEPLHIHGITNYFDDHSAKIVLGVENDGHRGKSHNFIVKAFNENTNAEIYFRNIDNVDKFIIFGCSIGETDTRYFKRIFSQSGKLFEIYGYGELGRADLKRNISQICNFDNFIRDNDVKFLSAEEFDSN